MPPLARCPDTESGVARVAQAVRIAVGPAEDEDGWSTVAGTIRMWQVTFLPDILRPDSAAWAYARTGLRAYAHALEELFL